MWAHLKAFFHSNMEMKRKTGKKKRRKSKGTKLRKQAWFQWSRANESSASKTAQIKIKQNRKLIVKGHNAQLCLLRQIQGREMYS